MLSDAVTQTLPRDHLLPPIPAESVEPAVPRRKRRFCHVRGVYHCAVVCSPKELCSGGLPENGYLASPDIAGCGRWHLGAIFDSPSFPVPLLPEANLQRQIDGRRCLSGVKRGCVRAAALRQQRPSNGQQCTDGVGELLDRLVCSFVGSHRRHNVQDVST